MLRRARHADRCGRAAASPKLALIDAWLAPDIRVDLEERLWRPIEAQATLEVLRDDPAFLADPGTHPAMFADHGIVHVRDVAIGLVRLVDTSTACCSPVARRRRQRFVRRSASRPAYLHDIGMVDMTPVGRRVHALFAAHAAFGPDVDAARRPPPGGRAGPRAARRGRRRAPFADAARDRRPRDAEPEPSPTASRRSPPPCSTTASRSGGCCSAWSSPTSTTIRGADAAPAPRRTPSPIPFDANTDGYADPTQSFAWLTARSGPQAELADDVIDALRALRAADVLRQRGTVLRTSGGFELCMDARDGQRRVHAAAGDAATRRT